MTIELTTPTTFREPPTAPGLPLIGNAITFMTSNGLPVPFMKEAAAKYGDLVRLSVGKQNMYLASHPDLCMGYRLSASMSSTSPVKLLRNHWDYPAF